MDNLQIPILFLIFNRPDTTYRVFELIREAKPRHLFIAADGPRKNNPNDLLECEKARSIVDLIDWECEVKTLFRKENLGCGLAVKSAIDWFFEQEESGIILEDDCLPNQSFFYYCADLLEHYKHNERIGMISGDQFIDTHKLRESYYFTNFPHLWGWATWRRVWKNYDFLMKDWPAVKDTHLLKEKTGSKYYAEKWKGIFDKVYSGKIDTWDYQAVFMLWLKNQLCIAPKINMVTNIGFGSNATHTTSLKDQRYSIVASNTAFPLIHPRNFERNKSKDQLDLMYKWSRPTPVKKVLGYIKSIMKYIKNKRATN